MLVTSLTVLLLYFCIKSMLASESCPIAFYPMEKKSVYVPDSALEARIVTIITPDYEIYMYKGERDTSIMFVATASNYPLVVDTLKKQGIDITNWKWSGSFAK